jgi:hypothetical protein
MATNPYATYPNVHHYRAIIAENPQQGNRIFLESGRCGSLEAALRVLVNLTGSMVEDMIGRRPVTYLDNDD